MNPCLQEAAPMPLRPRLFIPSDLPALHALIDYTIGVSYAAVYPPRAIQHFRHHHTKQKILAEAGRGQTLVIEDSGQLIATGTLLGDEIKRLFTHPERQGQGLGRTIMGELEARAGASGLIVLNLHSSLPAKEFYLSLGFALEGEASAPVGEGQELRYYVMSKDLRK
jgi:GNAT superfamily N-acetyltransferase